MPRALTFLFLLFCLYSTKESVLLTINTLQIRHYYDNYFIKYLSILVFMRLCVVQSIQSIDLHECTRNRVFTR